LLSQISSSKGLILPKTSTKLQYHKDLSYNRKLSDESIELLNSESSMEDLVIKKPKDLPTSTINYPFLSDYLKPLDIIKKPPMSNDTVETLKLVIKEQQQQIDSLQSRVISLEQMSRN